MHISPETLYSLRSASVGNGVEAWANSALIRTRHCRCDYGNCLNEVTAVVMVTSGGERPVVEVRTSCDAHIDRMHAGWANKRVAIVHVG
jgi:hypothetical protein